MDTTVPAPTQSRFDTDSIKIGIDTLCSIAMSSQQENFENLIAYAGGTVTCISGGLASQSIGTFCFNTEANSGEIHVIKLPGSL